MSDDLATRRLVSIIVPAFNGEHYLRESLESILAQTYRPIEVLVMDDASTDGTPDIIAGYASQVIHIRQPRNLGQFDNVNDGIGRARGEYIAVYHADDIYDPTIVEQEVAYLDDNPDVRAVFCKDIFIGPDGEEIGRLVLPEQVRGGRPLSYRVVLNTVLLHKNRILRCPSSMVRASTYRDVGPYRGRQFASTADLDMWLRIAGAGPIAILESYLIRYRSGHGSVYQRYEHVRTDPDLFFRIMEPRAGRLALAAPQALAAYEAHRAEDGLMRTVNHYILGRLAEARAVLAGVQPQRILASPQVQRGRLLILFLAMKMLLLLPRIGPVADIMYRRWHAHAVLSKPC